MININKIIAKAFLLGAILGISCSNTNVDGEGNVSVPSDTLSKDNNSATTIINTVEDANGSTPDDCKDLVLGTGCFYYKNRDSTIHHDEYRSVIKKMKDLSDKQVKSWLSPMGVSVNQFAKLASFQKSSNLYDSYILLVVQDYVKDMSYFATRQYYITVDKNGRFIDGMVAEESLDLGPDIDEKNHVAIGPVVIKSMFVRDTIIKYERYNILDLRYQTNKNMPAIEWQEVYESKYVPSSLGKLNTALYRKKIFESKKDTLPGN